MIVDRFWVAGYTRLYRPHVYKGETARTFGNERITRALACVTEDGRRLAPFPAWPAYLLPTRMQDLAHDEQQARRRLFGVAS